MQKTHMTITYAIVAAALGLALSSPSFITGALGAKTTTSGVHFQGPAPTISCSGSTCTSTAFTLAGLGQGTGSAQLTVNGYWDVTCSNPGQNTDVPGQRTTATGSSQLFSFTSQNGKADVSSLTATLSQPTSTQLASACPNGQWVATATTPHITSATLLVTFNGQTIYSQTYPPA